MNVLKSKYSYYSYLNTCVLAILFNYCTMSMNICQTSIEKNNLQENGTLVLTRTDFYANYKSPKGCMITISTCSSCSIELTFGKFPSELFCIESSSLRVGECYVSCHFIKVSDSIYAKTKLKEAQVYNSISSTVSLVMCFYNFGWSDYTFYYKIKKKLSTYTGAPFYLTSPNFPGNYFSSRNEVFSYLIVKSELDYAVKLYFNDWDLSQKSKVIITYSNSDGLQKDYYHDRRPPLMLAHSSIKIVFYTGIDNHDNNYYIGFKGTYSFLNTSVMSEPTVQVCGEYFHSHSGVITFSKRDCIGHDEVDCVWVVKRYQDRDYWYTQVSLHITEYSSLIGPLGFIDILDGNNSNSELIKRINGKITDEEFVQTDGFYIHLYGNCVDFIRVEMIFSSFGVAQSDDGCSYSEHFPCKNNRCISKTLRCSNTDYCGDNSNNMGCSHSFNLSCEYYKYCQTGDTIYCLEQECDNKYDCQDFSDEHDCKIENDSFITNSHQLSGRVVISALLVCVGVFIIIIIFNMYRRKKHRRGNQTSDELPSIHPDTVNHTQLVLPSSPILAPSTPYSDLPPSYEEVCASMNQNKIVFPGYDDRHYPLPTPI